MDLIKNKKGMQMGSIGKWIGVFIGITVLFLVVAELYPEASDAGDDLNESGLPLGSLFVGGGVVFVILAAGILFVVIKRGGF